MYKLLVKKAKTHILMYLQYMISNEFYTMHMEDDGEKN
jgi:hypothetical protein